MTYAELATIKTSSMEVNLIIDDVIASARWGMTKKEFKAEPVSKDDAMTIYAAIQRFHAAIPTRLIPLTDLADEAAFMQRFMTA